MAVKPRMRMTRLRPLAAGGMAELTLAEQTDGRKLVVRELRRRNVFHCRLHLGFVRGTAFRRQLTPHPHIIGSLERGYSGLVPYEVIEYVDGANLRLLAQVRDPAVVEYSLAILRQTAAAIAHVHESGIIHLDIKAENVLVPKSFDGGPPQIKLTDFDLSRRLGQTRTMARSGTEAYMAPEQLRHGVLGPAADIFAFGVMAYNLVTGRMPFEGYTAKEMLRRHLSHRVSVKSPCQWNPDLEPKLDWLIMRCLEKNPAKRFPNMSYLAQEIGKM